MANVEIGKVTIERMARAVDKVRERMLRACAALDAAKVPYAVAGGNAVAAWVSQVDEAAVRYTQDVDILLRRESLDDATAALSAAGFSRRHVAGIEMFLDGPDAKARDAVHVVLAGEKVRPDYVCPAADVEESEATENFRVLSLEALVRMKLTSYRLKDRVHLLDMLSVGLIDDSWCDRFPVELSNRLRETLANPDA